MLNKITLFISISIAILLIVYIYNNNQKKELDYADNTKSIINTKSTKHKIDIKIDYNTNTKKVQNKINTKQRKLSTQKDISNEKYIQYRTEKHIAQQKQIKTYISMKKNQELIIEANKKSINKKNLAKAKILQEKYKPNSIRKKQLEYQNLTTNIHNKNNVDKQMNEIIKKNSNDF